MFVCLFIVEDSYSCVSLVQLYSNLIFLISLQVRHNCDNNCCCCLYCYYYCCCCCCLDSPTGVAERTLKLVAKCVQNVANLVEFKSKEPFMKVVNPFIVKQMEKMKMFIDQLSVSNNSDYSGGTSVSNNSNYSGGTSLLRVLCL